MKKVVLLLTIFVLLLVAPNFSVAKAAQSDGGGGSGNVDVLKNPPSTWLFNFVPDFGPAPGRGIDFIKNDFIPFAISLLLFAVIALSLIFLVIGGIRYTISGGNKEGMVKAKDTITYALVGLALGLGSYLILKILGTFFVINLLGP